MTEPVHHHYQIVTSAKIFQHISSIVLTMKLIKEIVTGDDVIEKNNEK